MTPASIPPYLLSALQVAPYPMSKGRLLAYASAFGASPALLNQLSELPVATFVGFEDLAEFHEPLGALHHAERKLGAIKVPQTAANPIIERNRYTSGK